MTHTMHVVYNITMFTRKTYTRRRIITMIEWSKYLGIERRKISKLIKQYPGYNEYEIVSVLKFYKWFLKHKT